jgi:hypothetical protein
MELYFFIPDMLPCVILGTGATLPLSRFDYIVKQNVQLLQHMMCETIKHKVTFWIQDAAET